MGVKQKEQLEEEAKVKEKEAAKEQEAQSAQDETEVGKELGKPELQYLNGDEPYEDYFGENLSNELKSAMRFAMSHPTVDIEVPEEGIQTIFDDLAEKVIKGEIELS